MEKCGRCKWRLKKSRQYSKVWINGGVKDLLVSSQANRPPSPCPPCHAKTKQLLSYNHVHDHGHDVHPHLSRNCSMGKLEVSSLLLSCLASDSNPKKERETRHAPKRKELWMRPELVCTMSPSNQRAQTIDDAIPQISLSVFGVCSQEDKGSTRSQPASASIVYFAWEKTCIACMLRQTPIATTWPAHALPISAAGPGA